MQTAYEIYVHRWSYPVVSIGVVCGFYCGELEY